MPEPVGVVGGLKIPLWLLPPSTKAFPEWSSTMGPISGYCAKSLLPLPGVAAVLTHPVPGTNLENFVSPTNTLPSGSKVSCPRCS